MTMRLQRRCGWRQNVASRHAGASNPWVRLRYGGRMSQVGRGAMSREVLPRPRQSGHEAWESDIPPSINGARRESPVALRSQNGLGMSRGGER